MQKIILRMEAYKSENYFGKILMLSVSLPLIEFSFGVICVYKLCLKIRSQDRTGIFWVSFVGYLHIMQPI